MNDIQLPEFMQSGKPFFPSNGSEGADFHLAVCGRCKRDLFYRLHATLSQEEIDANPENAVAWGKKENRCELIDKAQLTQDRFIAEWIYKDGIPTCTAFEAADAARGGSDE